MFMGQSYESSSESWLLSGSCWLAIQMSVEQCTTSKQYFVCAWLRLSLFLSSGSIDSSDTIDYLHSTRARINKYK